MYIMKNRTLNNSNGHILRWWRNAAHTRRQKTPIEIWRQDCSQSFSRKSDRFSHMSRPPPQIRSQISHRSSHRSLCTSQISHRFWSQISHRFLTDFLQISHRFLTGFSQISHRLLTDFFLPMAEGNLWEIRDLACVFEFLVDDSSNWVSLLMT